MNVILEKLIQQTEQLLGVSVIIEPVIFSFNQELGNIDMSDGYYIHVTKPEMISSLNSRLEIEDDNGVNVVRSSEIDKQQNYQNFRITGQIRYSYMVGENDKLNLEFIRVRGIYPRTEEHIASDNYIFEVNPIISKMSLDIHSIL